jgi:hypothetical protein
LEEPAHVVRLGLSHELPPRPAQVIRQWCQTIAQPGGTSVLSRLILDNAPCPSSLWGRGWAAPAFSSVRRLTEPGEGVPAKLPVVKNYAGQGTSFRRKPSMAFWFSPSVPAFPSENGGERREGGSQVWEPDPTPKPRKRRVRAPARGLPTGRAGDKALDAEAIRG